MLFERCHSYGRIAAFGAGLAALWTASALAQTTTPDAAPAAPADPYAGNFAWRPMGPQALREQIRRLLDTSGAKRILGNVSGGQRRGFDYDGLTTATVQIDSRAAFGWAGG
jgi:hypothetical protein